MIKYKLIKKLMILMNKFKNKLKKYKLKNKNNVFFTIFLFNFKMIWIKSMKRMHYKMMKHFKRNYKNILI